MNKLIINFIFIISSSCQINQKHSNKSDEVYNSGIKFSQNKYLNDSQLNYIFIYDEAIDDLYKDADLLHRHKEFFHKNMNKKDLILIIKKELFSKKNISTEYNKTTIHQQKMIPVFPRNTTKPSFNKSQFKNSFFEFRNFLASTMETIKNAEEKGTWNSDSKTLIAFLFSGKQQATTREYSRESERRSIAELEIENMLDKLNEKKSTTFMIFFPFRPCRDHFYSNPHLIAKIQSKKNIFVKKMDMCEVSIENFFKEIATYLK